MMTTLRDRLTVLETEAAQHASVVSNMTDQNREKIDKLQEEKAMLEVWKYFSDANEVQACDANRIRWFFSLNNVWMTAQH